MEGFPSGQREQTVNLSSMTSVVRIHHLPPKEPILIRVSVLFWCQVEWIRKPALRNVPVARFNRRGFRRNGSKSTTGRVGRRVAVRLWDCTSQSRQARARSEGKNRLFDSEINLYRLFGTIYCRLRRYPVGGAHCAPRQRKIIRFVGEHSDSLRAAYGGCSLDVHCGGCVRPYGSVGVDEFTSGVPRSYLRAPSLAALPQQSESTTGRAGTRVAVRPWAAIANPGRHAPNPKERQVSTRPI